MAWSVISFMHDTESDFIGTLSVKDDTNGFTYISRIDVTSQKGKDEFKNAAINGSLNFDNIKTKIDTYNL